VGGISEVPDLSSATATVARVVVGIDDGQLGAATPCEGATVADLLDHLDGLAAAFTFAARKDLAEGSQAPSPDGSRLTPDWRTRIPERLAGLASGWRDAGAWTGMTRAGGIDMPAEVAGSVAINEVVVHGWDIAVATGQEYTAEPEIVEAALAFVQPTAAQSPDGTPGLFGPPVPVPDDAPLLARLLGLTGRDPGWKRP
jgi:uncharacterized protein (TIGR03086 family)